MVQMVSSRQLGEMLASRMVVRRRVSYTVEDRQDQDSLGRWLLLLIPRIL